jgi:hypothetical protein
MGIADFAFGELRAQKRSHRATGSDPRIVEVAGAPAVGSYAGCLEHHQRLVLESFEPPERAHRSSPAWKGLLITNVLNSSLAGCRFCGLTPPLKEGEGWAGIGTFGADLHPSGVRSRKARDA